MEPKIFFWIDNLYVHFFLAKALQENINCKLFGLFEVTDKPKKYFEKQNLVKFEKIWFYYDYIKKIDKEPDLEYLQKFEKKYNINCGKRHLMIDFLIDITNITNLPIMKF